MSLTTDSTTVVQPMVVTTTTTTSQPAEAQQAQAQGFNYQPTEDDKNMGLQVERTTAQQDEAVSAETKLKEIEAKHIQAESVSINSKITEIDAKMNKILKILEKAEVTKYDLQEVGLRKTDDKLLRQCPYEVIGGAVALWAGTALVLVGGAAIGVPIMLAGLAVTGKGFSDIIAGALGGYDLHLSQEKYRDDLKEKYMQLAEERESLNAQLAELNR